jgi:hypothetical protein
MIGEFRIQKENEPLIIQSSLPLLKNIRFTEENAKSLVLKVKKYFALAVAVHLSEAPSFLNFCLGLVKLFCRI